MNEEERAAWLARAVDNLIQRREAAEPPKELNNRDLEGLLRVAKARLELSDRTAQAGLQYEGAVWQRVLDRLESRAVAPRLPGSSTFFLRRSKDAKACDPSEEELKQIEEVAALRQSLSAELMAFAETHREAVWDKVQSRLAARSERKGLFSFLRRDRKSADEFAQVLEGLAVGQTVWKSSDSRIDELVELARKRRVLADVTQQASAHSQQRVWARLSNSLQGRAPLTNRPYAENAGPVWQRLAVGAAGLALILAAVGPIPATGIAGHPLVGLVESVGDHVGVTESAAPSGDTGTPHVLQGTPVTGAEASQLLGVSVSELSAPPAAFTASGSLYYSSGVTNEAGTFLVSYTSTGGALLVFQEAATNSDLGVIAGAATNITLTDGTMATYVEGVWAPDDSGFGWSAGGGRSLVFDRGGVRTIIQYVGDPAAQPDLEVVAAGLN
jgi:hypothetical protein